MEQIITIVGFLGAGKTTLLKQLVKDCLQQKRQPYVILNDYENANIDAAQFLEFLDCNQIKAMSGSCICCSGLSELRSLVNTIPTRDRAITFIEANGTTDACDFMEFLGLGLNENFSPPIQIAVVDARLWQKRGIHNELESNQVQVASLIVLNHTEAVDTGRLAEVKSALLELNPFASVMLFSVINANTLDELTSIDSEPNKIEHQKFHWASCSVDLPDQIFSEKLAQILESLPDGIIRAKGCTRLDKDSFYSHIECTPSGEVFVRRYNGQPRTGPKLVTVGPGSDPIAIQQLIDKTINP